MSKTFDSSTRNLILTMLRTNGALNAGEMARRLGITEMAVRRHLNTLQRDRLVRTEQVRQAIGRPVHVYSLTEEADDRFPKNYHRFALDMLQDLWMEEGEEAVGKLFLRRKERLIRQYEERMSGKSLEERVEQLAAIQQENGYMVEWSQSGRDSYIIQEHNCPIAQVANQFQHACTCELDMFKALLAADVEQTECLAKGGGRCTYVVGKQST